MGTFLELLLLLFLILITISIIGLLWSFIKNKPKRSWMICLTLNLFFFIATAVFDNNYLLSKERKEAAIRYQEQQQSTRIQNEKSNEFQSFTTQKLAELEQNLAEKATSHDLKSLEAQLQIHMTILNAKIDYLTTYISNLVKSHQPQH